MSDPNRRGQNEKRILVCRPLYRKRPAVFQDLNRLSRTELPIVDIDPIRILLGGIIDVSSVLLNFLPHLRIGLVEGAYGVHVVDPHRDIPVQLAPELKGRTLRGEPSDKNPRRQVHTDGDYLIRKEI